MINSNSNNYLVSICCLTYNHEKYVSDALDGFLMQKTDFDFEVLIHDDASADNTPKIIREYQTEYPTKIKPIYQEINQWSMGVRLSSTFQFSRAKGKYIAICEGDDYWTDPLKLQKQVDFLEKNIDYGLIASQRENLNEVTGKITRSKLFNVPLISYSFKDFILDIQYPIATLTVLVRKDLIVKFINFQKKYDIIGYDFSIWLFISYYSKIGILKDITAVYRVIEESLSHRTLTERWILKKTYYSDFLKYIKIFKDIDKVSIKEAHYYRVKKIYFLAGLANDVDSIKAMLLIFNANNDYIRYFLTKFSIGKPYIFKFIYYIEKIITKLRS